MDKKIKSKWIKALLSGKFKQATGWLRVSKNKKNSYCCLGVLARVSGARWKSNRPMIDGNEVCNHSTKLLSDEFLLENGLTLEEQSTLAQMNDDGKSFKQIAAYIKKNIKGESSKKK